MSSSALLEMPADLHTPTFTPPAGVHRIVLTGFMGSGKTSVGALLAERLGWRFRDLDTEVEQRAGLTVAQIFAQQGEARFRRLESAALVSLLGQRDLVLALGGGAPEELGNRLLLEQTPRTAVVYLAAPLDVLIGRCQQQDADLGTDTRPLLAQAEARFHARRHLYERIAGHTVHTSSRSLEDTAEAVLEMLAHTQTHNP